MVAHVKHHLRAAQELAGGTHWLCSHDNHGSLQACNQMRKALPKASTILKMPPAYTCVSQPTLSSSSLSMSQLTAKRSGAQGQRHIGGWGPRHKHTMSHTSAVLHTTTAVYTTGWQLLCTSSPSQTQGRELVGGPTTAQRAR
jgi:hypothetical protein